MKNLIYAFALIFIFITVTSCNKGEAVIPSKDISAKDGPLLTIADTTNFHKHLLH